MVVAAPTFEEIGRKKPPAFEEIGQEPTLPIPDPRLAGERPSLASPDVPDIVDPSQPPIPGGAVESPYGIFLQSYGHILSGLGIPFERISKAIAAPIWKTGLAYTPDIKRQIIKGMVEQKATANTIGLSPEAKQKELERLRLLFPELRGKVERPVSKELSKTFKDAAKALVPLPGMTKDTESVAKIASDYYKEMTGNKPPFWYGGAMEFASTIVAIEGVRATAKFVAGFAKWAKGKPPAQVRPARAEADAAWAHYRKTGDRTQWDAVRVKYAGIKPERVRARQAPPEVKEFGKYPIARAEKVKAPAFAEIKARPTEAIPAPSKPKAAITTPEAKITPKAKKTLKEVVAEAEAARARGELTEGERLILYQERGPIWKQLQDAKDAVQAFERQERSWGKGKAVLSESEYERAKADIPRLEKRIAEIDKALTTPEAKITPDWEYVERIKEVNKLHSVQVQQELKKLYSPQELIKAYDIWKDSPAGEQHIFGGTVEDSYDEALRVEGFIRTLLAKEPGAINAMKQVKAQPVAKAEGKIAGLPTPKKIKPEQITHNMVGTIDVDLPPVKEGHIRLYRGQHPTSQKDLFHPKRGILTDKEIKQLGLSQGKGGWYTPFVNYALNYAEAQGKGYEIVYVDVPVEVAEKYRGENAPEGLSPEGYALEYYFPELREASAQTAPAYIKPSKVESVSQGNLYGARQAKKRAWERIQNLRQKIKDEPLGGNRTKLRVELLKAEDAHKEAINLEKQSLAAIERRAQELGQTTIKAEGAKVKQKGKAGFVDVSQLLRIHKTISNVIEPAKIVETRLGKEPYAAVIKGIHQADVGRIEFNEAQIEGQDKSLNQMSEWFFTFPDKDLKNFMTARGEPTTVNAFNIQRDARNKLPKELRKASLFKTIQKIADDNYKYLQSVVGDDIHRVEDYFYGIYKNAKKVDKLLDHWKTTKRFTKEKKLPTVADALDYDSTLELRSWNPIENLKAEYVAISHLEGMNWLKDELLRTGQGKFIDSVEDAPLEWDKVQEPVFDGLRLDPDLARLINNLISTNKVTRNVYLNTLREINNVSRTIKFIGSAFHLLSVLKQSIADSGYLGFLYKKTALRGFTRGFKANDPIFRTTAYKDYIRHGGGHRYSVETEARRTFNMAVNALNRNMGIAVKVGTLPLKIPTGFVNWMFQSYIPKVKYSKFLDVVAEKEKKLGRVLTSPEKIDIIKEQQNFYGMMNERLFGRSGTVTSTLRFYFMSPGYAEGNYRTMLKAALQWGGKSGFNANRSRSNIINSWLITATAATVGTMIFTGKPPKKPETLDDARDLFKIDTGKSDEKGRKIMIDMMTYDKDYWNVAFNTLRLRPDIAIGKSWKRIGGMKAPTAEIIVDLALMSMGKAIYDWKGDRVVEITDPFLQKAMKLTTYEVKNLVPISVSVFQQSKKRDIDTTVAAIETLLGFRPTKTEKDAREQVIISKMYSLAGQREELTYYIGQTTDPKEAVRTYNKTVNDILNSSYTPKSMKDEWGPKLLVDYENVVMWKRFPAGKMTDAELQRSYDEHTLSVPYKRRGEPFRSIGSPKKGSERRVSELEAEANKRGIKLTRGPRKPPRG